MPEFDPWPESASELYRPSDRSLSAKLVLIFADRGCHVVSVTDKMRQLYYVHFICLFIYLFILLLSPGAGARGSVVVKALCYKPEGRGFDSR
jgi:hypothetical protein